MLQIQFLDKYRSFYFYDNGWHLGANAPRGANRRGRGARGLPLGARGFRARRGF
jgi:hypothetical protein